MTTRPLFLHIGASKTGTSSLQRGLFRSSGPLAEQDIGMPLTGRAENVEGLLRPLGWITASGFVEAVDRDRLHALSARVAESPGERLLLSCEDVCEAGPERIDLVVDTLERGGAEPHVVLSVRSLAAVLPSEWQQFLKRRLTLDYPTFLEQIRDRRGEWAEHFWRRQDVVAICRRWADRVGPQRLHVVVTPDRRTDPAGLYRLFGEIVGFDHTRLTWPVADVNASWGYVEAEVYRRVNVALGDRLPRYERDYQPAVRRVLAGGVLPRGKSARIPLPPEHRDWVSETGRESVEYLRGSGIRIVGDVQRLVPGPDDVGMLPRLEEAEVSRATTETLANVLVFAWKKAQGDAG